MAKKHDVIQINGELPEWTGCLLIVESVGVGSVLAYLRIPFKGYSYIRLTNDQYEVIGESEFEVRDDESSWSSAEGRSNCVRR